MTHKEIDFKDYAHGLFKELFETKEEVSLIVRAHLYIEYLVNELIIRVFDEPKRIFDMEQQIGFHNKFEILQATGVFKKHWFGQNLQENILKINEIRNKYAHNFNLEEGGFKQSIKDKIEKLKLSCFSFDKEKKIPTHTLKSISKDPLNKFRMVSLQSCTFLANVIESLDKEKGSVNKP